MRVSSTAWPRQRWWLFVLALGLTAPSTALASTLQPSALEQLMRDARFIVRGKVEAVRPGQQSGGVPITSVLISIEEQWRGPRLSRLHLLLPRETGGGISQEVPGVPTFRVGEEVLLFVAREAAGQYRVVGGKQGKFSVKTDPRTQKEVAEDVTGSQFDLAQIRDHITAPKKPAP